MRPIEKGVEASPFRRVYGMHRYFARRPHNLFSQLISHYTDEGQVVLDPFFGGGVTLVEACLLGRRAIGFDLNPMAGFITRMELEAFDDTGFIDALEQVRKVVQPRMEDLFGTECPSCMGRVQAKWFEISSTAGCHCCGRQFAISAATKRGPGRWACPSCDADVRFSASATDQELLDLIYIECPCGYTGTKAPDVSDERLWRDMPSALLAAEKLGLWIPNAEIPDCNMQRESALHKKGITQFRDLFTPRTLLAWGTIRRAIMDLDLAKPATPWLWFAFSSSLRYANRMVTLNPGWRGMKPLEWAKPGYWLPPVHLEVNSWDQLEARAKSFQRAQAAISVVRAAAPSQGTPKQVITGTADVSVNVASSTSLPLQDGSVDAVITDPPYGSYVHYMDLTNFWAVWLPPELGEGLGAVGDTSEEAVVARKRGFVGAKTVVDYQYLLERCFSESFRVLKPNRFMVLTFNNREPRAWIAVLAAAAKAGFTLDADGVIFQDGIRQYEHTSQSRRAGSVIGDFVYSFKRPAIPRPYGVPSTPLPGNEDIETWLLAACRQILKERPLAPRELFAQLYLRAQVYFLDLVRVAGEDRVADLLALVDEIDIFDSHRKQALERHLEMRDGLWHLRDEAA